MKKIVFFIIASLLIAIGVIGCKKNKDYPLEGKWKLDHVYIFTGSPNYLRWHTIFIDSLENSIIYDFRKKNKLIVTSSISGYPQTNEYSYKCVGRGVAHVVADYDDIQLKIDKNIYYGSVGQKDESMTLINGSSDPTKSVKPQKPIDEIDLILIEQDSLSFWQKEFIKLK